MWKKVWHYLNITTLFKGDKEKNVNLRLMHGINRISIFMFIIALIILLFRYVIFPK